MRLFHTKPYQSTTTSLVFRMSQAFFRERTPKQLPFQNNVYEAEISPKGIRLVNWMRKACSFAWIFPGVDQEESWMSATKSNSEKWRWGNLEAIGLWSIQLSNHNCIESPFPRIQELPCWRWGARDLILFQMQDPAFGFPKRQMEKVLKYLSLS